MARPPPESSAGSDPSRSVSTHFRAPVRAEPVWMPRSPPASSPHGLALTVRPAVRLCQLYDIHLCDDARFLS